MPQTHPRDGGLVLSVYSLKKELYFKDIQDMLLNSPGIYIRL